MIVDTSALLAVLLGEEDADIFKEKLANNDCLMSVASFVEASIIAECNGGDGALRQLDALIRKSRILLEPVTEEQAFAARQGYSDFGKGKHPAGLNLGDSFSYALAKVKGEPLLFKGNDFRRTDIEAAIP